uniref:Uncharacterized protein n=1 Tax=Photinus pyralis TaxID=7054 RepID=A0A1Y1K9E3_PHOPY
MNSRFDNHKHYNDRRPFKRKGRHPYKHRPDTTKYGIIHRVRTQTGVRSQIVLVYNPQLYEPISVLNNATQRFKGQIQIQNSGPDPNDKSRSCFSLNVNNERISHGSYLQESTAKKHLYELAIENLRKTCFSILRVSVLYQVDVHFHLCPFFFVFSRASYIHDTPSFYNVSLCPSLCF